MTYRLDTFNPADIENHMVRQDDFDPDATVVAPFSDAEDEGVDRLAEIELRVYTNQRVAILEAEVLKLRAAMTNVRIGALAVMQVASTGSLATYAREVERVSSEALK